MALDYRHRFLGEHPSKEKMDAFLNEADDLLKKDSVEE
jgi:hypothetical protein